MNIVIDAIPLISPHTGIGKYTYQIARHLREVDPVNEYQYFYGYFSRHLIAPQEGGAGKYKAKEMLKKIPLLGPTLRQIKSALGRFSRSKFDLYFEPNLVPLDIPAQKTVVTVPDFSFRVNPEWHPRERVDYFEKVFWGKVKKADHIITISEFIRASAIQDFGFPEEKVTTIHLGYSKEIFKIYAAPELDSVAAKYQLPEKFILFVGSIEPRKNLLNLIQAYGMIGDALRAEVKLVLIGFKGWENGEIMNLLAKYHENIHYLGYVPEEDLGKIYNLASVFAFPTLYEGFGLPVLEAMACACPVVTSNVTSLPEVCSDAACYVNPLKPESIAQGLVKTLCEQEWKDSLIKKGLSRCQQFSWEKSAREHLKVFEKVYNS
jgi:glycosyltransferase involved in cell wall biosynthesis